MVVRRKYRKRRKKLKAKGVEYMLGDALIRAPILLLRNAVRPLFHGFGVGNVSVTKNGERVKSSAERRIAECLRKNGIVYQYEKKLFIRPLFSISPDFYLPEYDLYVEYWGLLEHPTKKFQYRKDMNRKKKIYKAKRIRWMDLDHRHKNRIEYHLLQKLAKYPKVKTMM